METFEVKRGLAKKLASEGGLAGVASKHFDNVDGNGDAFTGSHGIMTSITGEYNSLGKLVVDVSQVLPDFSDEEAMMAANDDRRRWSAFLDEATGYNSKQRGDKAKEVAKKAAKAKSSISQARHFMSMATNLSDETKAQAEEFISTIEGLLEAGDNTKAESTGKKLSNLLEA
tara:strand:- start:14 stop:529 length:516 start_codon:yes stop_codon:yes gene_type:complete